MPSQPKCFECGRPVLGLRGQDAVLDTFLLTRADEDVIAAGAFGDCHLICLATSRWSGRWVERIRQAFEGVRRYRRLHEDGSGTYYWNPGRGELLVVYPGGRVETVLPDELARLSVDRPRLPVTTRRMLFCDAETRREVREKAGAGDAPLAWLLERLGIEGFLLDPEAVRDATFRAGAEDATGIEVTHRYEVDFGREVVAELEALRAAGLPPTRG